MNRNTEIHFSQVPHININRSVFDRSTQHKTTFNAGQLIPIFCDEVLPGDTFSGHISSVVRMSTPIHPTMDNLFADIYWYSVPVRILWEHWKEFNGENNDFFWTQETEYEIPQIESPDGGWTKGTIADYLGVPTYVDFKDDHSINHLPFRAVVKVWNDWFRDQNVQTPGFIDIGDSTTYGTNGTDYVTDAICGGMPLPVAKYHDYFTSCLPQPLKSADVLLPLGSEAAVIGNGTTLGLTNGTNNYGLYGNNQGVMSVGTTIYGSDTGSSLPAISQPNGSLGVTSDPTKSGLIADLSNATAATVSQLRQAFAVQRLFEKDARGGTRYTEIIKAHFGTSSPDGRQQRAEYLGGAKIPINITQVVQTSSTDSTSPQGNTAAFSLTGDISASFTKSFTEHSILLCFVCVRNENTYQQGLEKMWSRKRRFDFYWPALANISEQPVFNKEIYAQGTAEDDEVFGYQEAWAEYRYKPSRVSGGFRSNLAESGRGGTLDSWHYADYYESLPTLSDDFIRSSKTNVGRTLAVTDEDQFIGDFYFSLKSVRPMPVFSVPGLIDHN